MCYSAMVEQSIRTEARRWGAEPDLGLFEQVFARRLEEPSLRIAKGLELDFLHPASPVEERIRAHIDRWNAMQAAKCEAELFAQKKRLADAERSLAKRETKKAREDVRIATNKIAWNLDRLGELKRTAFEDRDNRIFPFWFAPVLVMEAGRLVMKPMRYHCRPQGKPADYDKRYDGLYNARRDNLEGFWKNLFCRNHAVVIATSFYENVALEDFEKRPLRPGETSRNLVLHFNPQPKAPMLLACLWDRWTAPGQPDLLSFAAITDEPPPEVAAAGHDRCVIPLRRENLARWLDPRGCRPSEMYDLLDDRERPYYEHRLAA